MSNKPHLVLAAIISASTIAFGAACSLPSGEVNGPGTPANQNNGASDVKIITCAKTEFGMSMTLSVTNSTKGLASYLISAEAVETGTNRRVGEASTSVNALRAGQTTTTSAIGGLDDKVDKIDCKLVQVTRS